MIPYFVLGMGGLVLCILAAKFLFLVPFRGSVLVLAAVSALYLLVSLAIGLLVSSATKSQFVSSMVTLVVTFLPALMLSGFLFDLRSMPDFVRWISYALPARYYVALLQTIFLAGDIWGVILPDAGMLAADGGDPACRDARGHAQRAGVRRTMLASLLRILALIRKELLAILSDPRSRVTIFIPPVLQCLVFGYAATYDLNNVPYAVLDQDRSAASHELLARLDGSGVFVRVANLTRQTDIASVIDQRQALLVIQIGQDFERELQAGKSADIQVIADGRNSNTAGTALGYVNAIVAAFNAEWTRGAWPGRAAAANRDARLVQPQSRDALEHGPGTDRHAHHAADLAADGDVGRARARARHFRSVAGDAVPAGRDHDRQGDPVDDHRHDPGELDPARRAALVPDSVRRARTSRSMPGSASSCSPRSASACCCPRSSRPCSRRCSIPSCW